MSALNTTDIDIDYLKKYCEEALELSTEQIEKIETFSAKHCEKKNAGSKARFSTDEINPIILASTMKGNGNCIISETGEVYMVSAVSGSAYHPYKRAKTENKIKQEMKKDKAIARLRAKWEAKQTNNTS
jgi:hypothetical protein